MTATPDPPESADQVASLQPMSELPGPVRHRIVEWAAEALTGLTPAEMPAALTRVARFAPAKRAKVAAAALGQAVQIDGAFRAVVAERAAAATIENDPAQGSTAELVTAAARAYLLRLPEWDDLLVTLIEREQHEDLGDRLRALEGQVRTLTAALDRSQAALAAARSVAGSGGEPGDEADRLRQRLREQGSRLRELQQQIDGSTVRLAEQLAAAEADRTKATAEAQVWRQRAQAATERADAAATSLQRLREAAGDRRSTADRRVELLLGALEGAASGLRRELDLTGGGPLPADVVAARLPTAPSTGERTVDPAKLLNWFGLPGAHLIVDGYNVSKTGFADLSLSDQRDRLIRSLAALAARSSVEVTVVFDGAAVTAARPPGRGIRVLFSPAGVIADDVIKALVREEPEGRVVVVVSSDRQVAETAAADGAKTAPSATLIALISG